MNNIFILIFYTLNNIRIYPRLSAVPVCRGIKQAIKIIYQFTGNKKNTYVVYVLKAGNSIDKDGGFPLIMEHGNGSREIVKNPQPGNYYFHALTNETEWAVTLYEE